MDSNNVKTFYANAITRRSALPNSLYALSEFYAKRSEDLDAFYSADDTDPISVSFVDSSGTPISIDRATLAAALDEDAEYTENVLVHNLITGLDVYTTPVSILDSFASASRTARLNEAYFKELSVASTVGTVDSGRFMSDLTSRFGSVLPNGANALVGQLASGANVTSILQAIILNSTGYGSSEDIGIFDTTDYFGTNIFVSALASIGDDIAEIWTKATERYDSLSKLFKNLGEVMKDAAMYLIQKFFPDVVNSWVLKENEGIGYIGIPILSVQLALTDGDLSSFFNYEMKEIFPAATGTVNEMISFETDTFYSGNAIAVKWRQSKKYNEARIFSVQLKTWIETKLLTTNCIEIPTDTMTIRIVKDSTKAIFLEIYALNLQYTRDSGVGVPFQYPNSAYTKEIKTRMATGISDEEAFNAFVSAVDATYAEVNMWPVRESPIVLPDYATGEDISTVLTAELAKCGRPFTSGADYDPSTIVNNITHNRVNTSSEIIYYSMVSTSDIFHDPNSWGTLLDNRPAMLHYLRFAAIQLAMAAGLISCYDFSDSIDLSLSSSYLVDISTESVTSETDDLNASVLWIPYATNQFLPEYAHPQTTRERTAEMKSLFYHILLAAAAIVATVTFVKVKAKLRTKVRTNDQKVYNAYDDVAKIDAKTDPAGYKAALKAAAKAEKKAKRTSSFSSLVGGPSSNYSGGGSLSSSSLSESNTDIIEMIGG